MDIKNYLVLIRPYSLMDLLLVFLLARVLSITNITFNYNDLIFCSLYIFLWMFLTLALEAKHRHPYRKIISNKIPYTILAVSILISGYINIQSLLFIGFIWLSTYLYIKKEESEIMGLTSFLARGLYETSLFLFGVSLFIDLIELSKVQLITGIVLFLLYAARNLIADVRDVDFDENTFTVRFGSKVSYIVSLIFYLISIVLLFRIFSNFWIAFPVIVLAAILLVYDNGYALHRCSIIVTSFTAVNIISTIISPSPINIVYINILFMGVLSNLLFYESTPRKSNPKPTVSSKIRFLIFSLNGGKKQND